MNKCDEKKCDKLSAIVIGGGLVGTLCVCLLAERGYKVTMYEKRGVAEKWPKVTLLFNHKLIDVDIKENTIIVENSHTKETLKTTADFIVGADGAYSVFRSFLQKTPLYDFSQNFIDHGYLELCIPADRGNELQPNYLHIWPRGEFMMIALPNQDRSWTVTLFMPFKKFESIDSTEKLLQFFEKTFPDAVPLIGKKELESTYFGNSPSALVSIKCGRYDMGDKFLIIGDAAHAMVPFYGQGMNAGFEDCTLLNEILNQTQDDISKTIRIFTEKRRKDAHAICDLAMYNYSEMRDLVTKPTYKLRKIVDKYLGKLLPDLWVPLYNSVSFSHMGYSQCVENRKWQDKSTRLEAHIAGCRSWFSLKKMQQCHSKYLSGGPPLFDANRGSSTF